MSDGADFGDFDYSRLRRWIHAPKNLIRQSVRFTIRYFGAAIIQCSLQDQNIISEAVKNLCGARDMKAGSKLNIKKLPKLDLEIDYAKLLIHTQPNTTIQLSQIAFCEKSKIEDNRVFQYLAFVVNEDLRNTAYIFVCSNEIGNSIKKTYEQLIDMNILHTNCSVIRNAVRQVGCGVETSKKVQALWQSRDEMFRDAVNRIQVEMTRQFPLIDESLKKLTDSNIEAVQGHVKTINELKQSLIQAVQYTQSIALDSNEFIKQQLDLCLNPNPPTIKPTISSNTSIDSPMSFKNNLYDPTSSNMYEVPISSPRQLDSRPLLPTTPVPKIPVVYRTLPTRSAAVRKKSPAKTLFNTLKPKPRTKVSTFMSETSAMNNLTLTKDGFNQASTSKIETFVLEKNANNQEKSAYYEGTLGNWPKQVVESEYYESTISPVKSQQNRQNLESDYYEGTINLSKSQQEDPYYYCPMPADNVPTRPAPLPPNNNIRVIVENAEGEIESRSESSTSQRNSLRESNVFEDDDPESVYITQQQTNHYE